MVGSEEDGYANGADTSARFRNITGFLQLNRTHCILVDSDNHCLRFWERGKQVYNFVGRCENPDHSDGIGTGAAFIKPFSLSRNKKESNIIFVTVRGTPNTIRTVDLNTKQVGTISLTNSVLLPSQGFYTVLADSASEHDVMLTADTFVSKIQLPDTVKNVFGNSTAGFLDGSITRVLFNDIRSIVAIRKDVYIVADANNYRLRIIDLVSQKVTSICSGINKYNPGNISECSLDKPTALFYHGTMLYIGTEDKLLQMKGKIVKFN